MKIKTQDIPLRYYLRLNFEFYKIVINNLYFNLLLLLNHIYSGVQDCVFDIFYYFKNNKKLMMLSTYCALEIRLRILHILYY